MITDIHTHITPNVDDGSRSLKMSMEMIRTAAAQGCTKLFLTPHSDAFEWGRDGNTEYVHDRMRKVREQAAAENIPVQIYTGCEIYITRRYMEEILMDLRDGRIPSMNQSRYVLAEFSTSRGDFKDACYCLRRLIDDGWIPIIAHAERYTRTFTTTDNIRILNTTFPMSRTIQKPNF